MVNGLWTVVTVGLLIASTVYWVGFCDKLDTGLGRVVDDANGAKDYACATELCENTFSTFFEVWAASLLFYNLPELFQLFGIFERN